MREEILRDILLLREKNREAIMLFDTIAAISTPRGEGGIGIVRISGSDAFTILKKIFKPKSGKKIEVRTSFPNAPLRQRPASVLPTRQPASFRLCRIR